MKIHKQKLMIAFILFLSLRLWAFENYQQACQLIGDDDYVKYEIELITPLEIGTDFNLKITAFEDENCETAYLKYNQYFKIKALKETHIDLEMIKVTYTPLSSEIAKSLNLIQYCQKSNWTHDVEINVTGLVCDDYQQLAEKELLFQILKLEQNRLYFGETNSNLNGRTEQNRPIHFSIEFTKIFAKPSLNFNSIPLK